MSNNFDNVIILDSATDYYGFGRASGTKESTNVRIYQGANLAIFDAVITAPAGSIAILADGSIAVNTDGAMAWSQSDGIVSADPGNAGAIPVAVSGSVALTTAGAETRTLADPTFIGQTLSISLDVDGGDAVVTAASGVNQVGNTSLTFADAGDHLELRSVQIAGVPKWRIVANDGIALA